MQVNKLILGTAQFGMNYGITNQHGQIEKPQISQILKYAYKNNILTLDTAEAYNNSEVAIGKNLKNKSEFDIVTKLPPDIASFDNVGFKVKLAFNNSINRLGLSKLYGLLVHRSADLFGKNGNLVWEEMQALKDSGLVEKIGVSVYDGKEIDRVLKKFQIDLIQLPCNIVDQRLLKSGHLSMLHKAGIEVHMRSIFLQGILLEEPNKLPTSFIPFVNKLSKLRAKLDELKISPLEACIGFIKSLPGDNHGVVGISSLQDFHEIVNTWKKTLEINLPDLSIDDERLLNPALWPTRQNE